MLTKKGLIDAIAFAHLPDDAEIRVGDVTERSDFHCSVGSVVFRNGSLILIPGEDPVWKDETVASIPNMETVWPQEEESEDDKTDP